MKDLIIHFAELFYDAKDKNNAIKDVIDDVFYQIRQMYERIEKNETEIVFIGKSNNGKSTLLNALFQENIAPKKNGPYTAAIVEYRYGNEYSIILKIANQKLANIVSCNSADELYEELKNKATVSGDSNFSEAERIIVKIPSDLLKNNVVIYDTPGFGATKGEDEENGKGLHDDIVCDFLKKESYDQAFWVFRGDNASSSELEFLRKNITRYSYCSQNHFIVNIEDDFNEEEKNTYIKKYLKEFISSPTDVIFVNAKEIGINKDMYLQEYIQNFLKINHKIQYDNLVDLLNRFIVHCEEIEKRKPVLSCTVMASIKKIAEEQNYIELLEIINKLAR